MKLKTAVIAVLALLLSATASNAASYSFDTTTHRTLVISVVDIATVPHNCGGIRVWNRSSIADIFVRADGVSPSAASDGSWLVAPDQTRLFMMPNFAAPEIRLVSGSAAGYTLECE